MGYKHQVKSFLWDAIAEMPADAVPFAVTPGVDFTRERKLGFGGLLRFLAAKEGGSTAHELLKYTGWDANTLTASAFYQQRAKLLPTALPFLLYRFNARLPPTLYKGIYSLVACDGCEFNIARDPGGPDCFHPPSGASSRGFNSIHAVALYDILDKRYRDCVIQPGMKKNEFDAACRLIDAYPRGGMPIFIGDRGFSSYNLFAHAIENGVHFLVRAKDVNTMRLLGVGELPGTTGTGVEAILTRTQSKKKRKHPELAERYRYLGPEATFDYIEPGSGDEYALKLRAVRFEVAEGVFENIYTNLPADEFPLEEIAFLYHLRWDIETSFRDLKHTIGATRFLSKKPKYVAQEIWARLILFNFCSAITAHVVIAQGDTKYFYQVNFAMAMKVCHHFIRLRDDKPPPDVEGLIGRYTLPVRPNRTFARQHRFRLPASFCYRFS